MFKENDKVLFTAMNIVRVIWILLGIALAITGFAFIADGTGILILLLTFPICWAGWTLSDLLFSYLLDIKFIRNKLYGIDNSLLLSHINDETKTNEQKKS